MPTGPNPTLFDFARVEGGPGSLRGRRRPHHFRRLGPSAGLTRRLTPRFKDSRIRPSPDTRWKLDRAARRRHRAWLRGPQRARRPGWLERAEPDGARETESTRYNKSLVDTAATERLSFGLSCQARRKPPSNNASRRNPGQVGVFPLAIERIDRGIKRGRLLVVYFDPLWANAAVEFAGPIEPDRLRGRLQGLLQVVYYAYHATNGTVQSLGR
jgi:hypothetical protein